MNEDETFNHKLQRLLGAGFRVLVVAIVLFSIFLFMQVRNTAGDAKTDASHAVRTTLQVQAKSGAKTCAALYALTQVGKGIKFSAPTKTGTAEIYVIRLNKAIKNVYVATDCKALIGH